MSVVKQTWCSTRRTLVQVTFKSRKAEGIIESASKLLDKERSTYHLHRKYKLINDINELITVLSNEIKGQDFIKFRSVFYVNIIQLS